MSYRNVDPGRLKFLLSHALSTDELKRFFLERRNPLIMNGGKQNPPRGFEDAVQRVLRFTDGAHRVLADWLREQDPNDSSEYQSQLVPYFRSIENCHLKLPESEMRKLSRCGLMELYSESPSMAWLEFLSEPIDKTSSTFDVAESPKAEPKTDIPPEFARAFAEWAVGIRVASLVPDPTLATAALLAEAARSGDRDLLPPEILSETAWQEVAAVHRAAMSKTAPQKRKGFIAVAPEISALDRSFNYLDLDVVCTLSRTSGSGPYFLDVLCFGGNGTPFTLSDTDLRIVFPEEGRVILHPDSKLPTPQPGVAETYRVERFKTQRAIKVRAIALGAKLYRVIYVPHASDQKDQIRDWLKERASAHHARTIFVLADGLAIKPKTETSLSLPVFDWVFESWQDLEGVELARSSYVTSPLPQPDGLYECAPASLIARRYLKSLIDRKEARLTRQQLSDLSNLIGETDLLMTEEYRRRIRGNLGTLASTDAYYEELLAEVMTSPAVQRDIEQRKRLVAAQLDEELIIKQRALDNLRNATVAQTERLDKLRLQTEERTREIRNAIKKTFAHAKEHEAEMLGQLALWQELLAPAKNSSFSDGTDREPTDRRIHFSRLDPQSERIQDILASIGMEKESAETYTTAIEIIGHLGFPIVISGSGALHVGSRLARALAKRSVCVANIEAGLIESRSLNEVLHDEKHDVLVLRNGNLSDLSVYGPELLEHIAETASFPPSSRVNTCTVLLVEASGAAALPWPAEIEQLSFRLNLCKHAQRSGTREDEWLQNLPSPLQRKIWKRVEQEAEKREASLTVIETLRIMLWDPAILVRL